MWSFVFFMWKSFFCISWYCMQHRWGRLHQLRTDVKWFPGRVHKLDLFRSFLNVKNFPKRNRAYIHFCYLDFMLMTHARRGLSKDVKSVERIAERRKLSVDEYFRSFDVSYMKKRWTRVRWTSVIGVRFWYWWCWKFVIFKVLWSSSKFTRTM